MWAWIVLGVFLLLIVLILTIRVTFIVTYDQKLTTRVKIFTFEKEINLTEILRGILFPNKTAEAKQEEKAQEKEPEQPPQEQKADPLASIKAIYAKDGVAGVIEFIQTVFETLGKTVGTFFRHFIIDDLDVQLLIASSDAAATALEYGRVCGVYYPFIGVIRNGMTVRNYHEDIRADFLAPASVEKVYFRGSICVMNLLGIVLTAAKTFLVNLIKSKKTGNPVPKSATAKNNKI